MDWRVHFVLLQHCTDLVPTLYHCTLKNSRLLLLCLIILMSGQMAALFLIDLLVFPLQVLGSLLTSLRTAGVVVGGVMLMVFVQVVRFPLVEVSVRFLGHFNLFRGLRCGVLFWLSSLLVRFILGVDNLGVGRHVGRLLDGHHGSVPFELVRDGDLLFLIERMLHLRGLDTVRVSKVKGHADEAMVLDGRVREDDRLGNDAADEAADFGRRRVGNSVIDARRNLSGVCGRWYPVLLALHRFFIAISRAVVNHDGRSVTAPDPLVWSAGALPKRRRLVHAVRDRAFLPRPPGIWDSDWVNIPASAISAADIALWPYTPGLLVKWVSFLGSLHWPVVWIWGLVSFLLWNSSFFMTFGLVRGCLWRRGLGAQFQCRLFRLVQALIFGALVVLLVLL